MPYIKKEYICGDVIEVEKIHSGRYGAPGKKRKKKSKPTKEEIVKQNERNAIKKLRRKINCNFGLGDYHLILTYRKEERPNTEEARNIISQFLRKLRAVYKKHGTDLKYVLTTEYKNKAIHHHLIVNGADEWNVTKEITKLWPRGRPKLSPLDDKGDYSLLAEYFVKETCDSFRDADNPNKTRYTCSRNLKEPIVKKEIIKAGTWRKEPKEKKGWYIDKNSLVDGINPITGFRYQYYRLLRLQGGRTG